jgi:hypothetical protein
VEEQARAGRADQGGWIRTSAQIGTFVCFSFVCKYCWLLVFLLAFDIEKLPVSGHGWSGGPGSNATSQSVDSSPHLVNFLLGVASTLSPSPSKKNKKKE